MVYRVLSPVYMEVVPVLDYGQGPRDVAWLEAIVEAEDKDAARATAVKLWRTTKGYLPYCEVDENPFRGVRVWTADEYHLLEGEVT